METNSQKPKKWMGITNEPNCRFAINHVCVYYYPKGPICLPYLLCLAHVPLCLTLPCPTLFYPTLFILYYHKEKNCPFSLPHILGLLSNLITFQLHYVILSLQVICCTNQQSTLFIIVMFTMLFTYEYNLDLI